MPEWTPLWPILKPLIEQAQPSHSKWPRNGEDGWVGAIHSPLRDDKRPSFSVRPDSETDPGGWKDHATGEHGSMADLAQRMDVDPRRSRDQGLTELCLERRFDKETMDAFGVRETTFAGRRALVYGTAVGVDRVKYIDRRKGKRKYQWAKKGGRRHWYGLRGAAKLSSETVLVVNGEPSVWACFQCGIPAVCLCGEAVAPSKKLAAELAEHFRRVLVVYDRDDAGRAGAVKVVEVLKSTGMEAEARELPENLGEGGDVDDLHRLLGDAALAEALEALPVLKFSVAGGRGGRKLPPVTAPEPGTACTDLGNAERLIQRHGSDFRFDTNRKKWLYFNGRQWVVDHAGEVNRRIAETARSIYSEASKTENPDRRDDLVSHAIRSEGNARQRAAEELARYLKGVPVSSDQLDADPFLLNVGNGTVNLRTGGLVAHDRAMLLTRISPVEHLPGTRCPRWLQFLNEIFQGDAMLIRFIQLAVGYSLTGSIEEQVLFLLWGRGANGKSTFLSVLKWLLGEYAMQTGYETFAARRNDGGAPRNDLARLNGARLVMAAEADSGTTLAESLVKLVTGGELIVARFLYGEHIEFYPQFKLWLASNSKPVIRGQDHAIWRRIRLIPFTVTFSPQQQDKQLLQKLREELPGILRWALEGCVAWQQEGLGTATAVEEATQEYRSEMDVLADFLGTQCVEGPEERIQQQALFRAYGEWGKRHGVPTLGPRNFYARLDEHGYQRVKSNGARWVQGLSTRGTEGSEADNVR